MSDEQINIAIAEACGWKWNYENASIATKSSPVMYWGKEPINPLKLVAYRQLPDYCNDLNAMHEAEKTLSFEQAEFFEDELCDVAKKENDVLENPLPWRFSVCHATARQRAEAFLKAIGKWEDGK